MDFDFSVCIGFSVSLATDSSSAGSVQVAGIVGVHCGVNAHVHIAVKRLVFRKGVSACRHHFAHIIGLLLQERVRLAAFGKVAPLLAPVRACIVPLEGFLARCVAHATVVISQMACSS